MHRGDPKAADDAPLIRPTALPLIGRSQPKIAGRNNLPMATAQPIADAGRGEFKNRTNRECCSVR